MCCICEWCASLVEYCLTNDDQLQSHSEPPSEPVDRRKATEKKTEWIYYTTKQHFDPDSKEIEG